MSVWTTRHLGSSKQSSESLILGLELIWSVSSILASRTKRPPVGLGEGFDSMILVNHPQGHQTRPESGTGPRIRGGGVGRAICPRKKPQLLHRALF